MQREYLFFKDFFLKCGPRSKSICHNIASVYVLIFWPQVIWDPSSLTRNQTLNPCIRRWSLNHLFVWNCGRFCSPENRQRTTLSGGIYVPNHLMHLCYGYSRAPGAGGWWRNNHKCDSVVRFPWKSQCETLSKKQCLGRSSVKAHLQYSKWNPYSSILKDDLQ